MDVVFSAADAFTLTSREDPFPSVVLEALSVGVPVLAFDHATGLGDFLHSIGERGYIPYCDVPAMTAELVAVLEAGISEESRQRRHAAVTSRFDFKQYVKCLLDSAVPNRLSVSVAVPNYNYAHYMSERLGGIFSQTQGIHELIVLDDCSTDDSVSVIQKIAAEWDREICLVCNEINSGSVFAQWQKAAKLATGEFLWIAEADDQVDPGFLASILALLRSDPAMQIAFSDSRTIGLDGAPMWESYKEYYGTIEPNALTRTGNFDGRSFVERFLAVKNVILNVSSVVWRRQSLLDALSACDDLKTFTMAGDWRLYLQVLSRPGVSVGYEAQPLNVHRRHAESVTHALDPIKHLDEIARCQRVAAMLFDLSPAKIAAQAAYRREVAEQFGSAALDAEAVVDTEAVTGVGSSGLAPHTAVQQGAALGSVEAPRCQNQIGRRKRLKMIPKQVR
jgi:hypothetical protein